MAQENDMQRLQQEAVRRVREMQSRAQMAAQPQAGREGGGGPSGGQPGRGNPGGNPGTAGQDGRGEGGRPQQPERHGGQEGEGGLRPPHGPDAVSYTHLTLPTIA